jgi:hypothetical protein
MAIRRTSSKVAYSTNKPLQDLAPLAVAARRGPKPTDLADVATIWVDIVNHDVYIASGFQAGQAQWSRVDNDGGPGEFTSLTINPGPTSLTGEVTLTSGPLNLPFTNSIGLGVINVNSTRFIHNYGTNNNSVFLGLDAGNLTNTAQKNIGIGSDAGKSITSGSENTFIGHEAGTDNTGGIRNTFVGSSSGSNMVGSQGDTSQNTAVGFSALNLATTGLANTALGSQALRQVGTGDYNIGIGYQGGDSITGSISSCIFIGNKGSGAASNTIRIGTFGSGDNEHNNADIIGGLQIDTSQNVVVPVGDIKVTGANKGISFADNGDVLDIYRDSEAFTPTVTFGGGSTGVTYSTQAGRYTRIGNMVMFNIAIVLTSKGTDTGVFNITGLPFSVATTNSLAPTSHRLSYITTGATWLYSAVNGSNVIVYAASSGGLQVPISDTNVADNSQFYIQGTYFTS